MLKGMARLGENLIYGLMVAAALCVCMYVWMWTGRIIAPHITTPEKLTEAIWSFTTLGTIVSCLPLGMFVMRGWEWLQANRPTEEKEA